jgi:predicted PurR-regulated permease PerM
VRQDLQHYARLAAVVVVVIGCYQVLHPFVPAILFAAVACSSSWPLYLRARRAMGGRATLAALVMTLLLIVLVIGPTTVLALNLADDVAAWVDDARHLLDRGPPLPPDWIREIPLVGLLKSLIEPAKTIVLGAGKAFGASLLQLTISAFVAFFFYRDGEVLVRAAHSILRKLAGELGDELLATTANTVTGVVNGIFGTALAQALVAIIGFLIAGVPGALALGALTFLLSMVPVGPPLVWGGATVWLLYQGTVGWAIFMLLWGLFGISSIDNFVKPYLISRSSSLPMLLIVFGVFGGIVAFGFIGIFIGPPVLAVGLTLVQLWTARPDGSRGS